MRTRPPPSARRPAVIAVLVGVLLVTSSIAAGALTANTTGGTSDLRSTSAAVTCATGSTATAASNSAAGNVSISTWTAPGSTWDDLHTSDDVRARFDDDTITPARAGANLGDDSSVAVGDVVVHRIELHGSATDLLDRLDEQGAETTTENFRRIVHADNGIDLYYLGPTACPPRIALNESIENDAFRVVSDPERDELYLVLDVAGLYFELGDSGPEAEKWNWGHHQVTVAIDESSGLVSQETVVRDHYEVDRRRVEFDTTHDALLRVDVAGDRTVQGHASMAPGTTFGIELAPLSAPNGSAALTANATLDRNGSFDATFENASDTDEGVYVVRVSATPDDDAPYRLATIGDASGASLGASDHAGTGEYLAATAVTTTHGGFVVAENDTAIVAVSDYLEPGQARPQPDYDPLLWQNETLTITVYRDSDGDAAFDPDVDEPYRRAGDPVQTTVNVTVDVSERQPTTQTTSQPTTTSTTATATATTTSTTKDSAETTSTDPGGTNPGSNTPVLTPGFGGLAALLALLIGALFVRR